MFELFPLVPLSLFCKLAQTLRAKITAFGHDVNISVRCLRVLVQAVDFRFVLNRVNYVTRTRMSGIFPTQVILFVLIRINYMNKNSMSEIFLVFH